MRVWRLKPDLSEVYKSYQLVNIEKPFYTIFSQKSNDGIRFNGEYDNVEIYQVDGMKDADQAKLWTGGDTILTNERAKACLKSLLNGYVEFVPLKCKDRTLYMMHVVTVIEALDVENKSYGKSENGRDVVKYDFIPERVEGVPIFKVKLGNRVQSTEIFVSSEFKETVEQNHLTGFIFTEVNGMETICY